MQRDSRESFPTVLVATSDRKMCLEFVAHLQQESCLVLTAANPDEARQIIVSHSRPIHVLLIDLAMDGFALAARLNRYRPHMRAVFFSEQPGDASDTLSPENALAAVRSLLGIGRSADAASPIPIRTTSQKPECKQIRDITPRIAS